MNSILPTNTKLITFKDYEISERRILNQIIKTRKNLLIGTFNLQNIRLKINNQYIPLSDIIIRLVRSGVSVYFLLNSKASNAALIQKLKNTLGNDRNLMIRSCSRIHLKTIIIDLKLAYIGSANLTGYGLGTRSKAKRNFELGFITSDKSLISDIAQNFINIFNGSYCNSNNCFYLNNLESKRYCKGIK